MTHQRFSKMNTLCECRICGKKTHSSVEGNLDLQLCPACLKMCELENEHSDGRHTEKPRVDCPECNPEDEPWEAA